jgi:glycosyltransferase involved in cell wall biosynthesis
MLHVVVAAEPLVSVVLPTFNGEERVLRAIGSVLRQDYRNVELLVVDDASTDHTARVVANLQDPCVKLLRQELNAGPYAARARAIDAARGELIAFIDDDDEWFPGKLRRQLAFFRAQPDIALVHSAVVDVFTDGSTRRRALHRRANQYRENLCQDRLATSSVVVKRSAIYEAGGFDQSLRAFGDWDLWLRILRIHSAAAVEQPLVTVNLRAGSIQRGSVEAFERTRRIVLEKHRPELQRLGLERRALSLHQYAVAAKLQLAGRAQEARGRALQSLRLKPSAEALALLGMTCMRPEASHWTRLQLRRARSLLRL